MEMPKRFDSFYTPVTEKDEHKKSKLYKKLSPKIMGYFEKEMLTI